MPLCESMRMHNTSPFQCQTHQHLSRWSTQQKHLWASQPPGGLPTTSLGWGGDIPRGSKWGSRTSVGQSTKATTLEMGSTSKDIWLQITLSRTTQGDSPEAVPLWLLTPVSSPHSVTECPSEAVTGPSLTEKITDLLLNPMMETPGESSTCNSPYSMTKKEGDPPIQERPPGLPEATTSLPWWIFTGGYGQPHGSFQLLPLTWFSREGYQPNSSCIMGHIHQPVGGSIWKVLSETELKLSSKLTSFCSQTWLLLLVCLGKCIALRYPKKCCSL